MDLRERLERHARELLTFGGTNASDLRRDLLRAAAILARVTQLADALEAEAELERAQLAAAREAGA